MADPISDMITRMRNAQAVQKRSVVVPYSSMKNELARVLKESGFVEDAIKRGRRNRRLLDIVLAYDADGQARMHGIRRISKQSQRIYAHATGLHASRKSVHGMFIISTSRGVMSSLAARRDRIGGEVLCEVW
ncbi:MAG: 30S ribosomal protein S8 [Parcubacteria group bacterium Gr01-1014_70]|nr:MAG: 30S ribosomal protein S8 [Parcubacteria group bacterium Gr01-1014_70]